MMKFKLKKKSQIIYKKKKAKEWRKIHYYNE